MNEPAALPAVPHICQCGSSPAPDGAGPTPTLGPPWHVRVTMFDGATGRELVLAHTRHDREDEARLATEWFPAIDHYSVFSLEVVQGSSCVERHPICGLAFAARLGQPLQAFIDNGRARGRRVMLRRGEPGEGRTLQ